MKEKFYQICFGSGILLLLLSAIGFITNHPSFADKIVNLSFFCLAFGVFVYILNLKQ